MNAIFNNENLPWAGKPSIYGYILEQGDTLDGTLPDDEEFWSDKRYRWVVGGMDGAFLHHEAGGVDPEFKHNLVRLIVLHSMRPRLSLRKALYETLVSSHIVSMADEVLADVREHPWVNAQRLLDEAIWMIERGAHRNVVKFGIAMLRLFRNERFRDLLFAVGRHEEFTLYAAAAIQNGMEDGNDVLFELEANERLPGEGRRMAFEINDRLVPDIGYLIYRKCTPSWEIAENIISFYDITYVVEGRGVYVINGVPHEVKRGDLLCVPTGSLRKAHSTVDDLMHLYSANFKLYDMNGEMADLPLPLVSHIGIKSDLIGLFRELSNAWVRKEPGYRIKTRGLLLVIIHRLIELILLKKDSASTDYRVKKAISYISENYANDISVKELAEMVGLNPVYFGALFKKETGMLVHQYLAQTRINHAQDMLQNGECNVTEAAERCGYKDLSHFRKQFRMIKGYTPSHCLRA